MGTSIRELIEMPPTQAEVESFVVTDEMWQRALDYIDERKEALVKAAAFSQRNALSHRVPPFKVGCAVIGLGPKPGEGEYIVWQACNFKPFPKQETGNDKRCAERNALDAAQSDCRVIFGIATCSGEIGTGDSTKAANALHPCRDCRDYYRELLGRGFLREDTRILSGNNSGEKIIVETRTLKEMLDLYADDT